MDGIKTGLHTPVKMDYILVLVNKSIFILPTTSKKLRKATNLMISRKDKKKRKRISPMASRSCRKTTRKKKMMHKKRVEMLKFLLPTAETGSPDSLMNRGMSQSESSSLAFS